MELRQETPVVATKGQTVGKLDKIVVDPVSEEVTHLVVRKGMVFSDDRVIPVDRIEEATVDRIRLRDDEVAVKHHPKLKESCYVALDDDELGLTGLGAGMGPSGTPVLYGYSPVDDRPSGELPPGAPAPRIVADTCTNLPQDAAVLSEGTSVIAADREALGKVEQVLIKGDPSIGRVTHFVVSSGMLKKERRLIPIEWVESIDDEAVQLAVGSHLVKARLPDYVK